MPGPADGSLWIERPEWLAAALDAEGVRRRYWSKVYAPSPEGCWYWTGAVSGKGHGRFWIGNGHVIIAHRFAYALAHPGSTLPAVVAHECDNPLCQNPGTGHLHASTHAENRAEWSQRRFTIASPLRDARGSLGRAIALRGAARRRAQLDATAAAGLRPLDRDQPPLW
ncbi:hypothetical protein [Ruania zhangjianzhongii]|uniref:hypothetical protein n=1 Tax=Ruania zhangjianzhongii TaxID=2603206 RepID=UPI0011CBA5A6|nr:hypothetical protein [Ruania zhangjianzhongii]